MKKVIDCRSKRIISLLLVFMLVLSALSTGLNVIVKADPSVSTLSIETFDVSLVYGADKVGDQYIWTPTLTDSNHLFVYRINYAFSGQGDIGWECMNIRVPKTILKNRDGEYSDECELSVPAKDQAESDTVYAYYEDGDCYVITNLMDVEATQDGFFEVSYSTKQLTYEYKDGDTSAHTAPQFSVTLSREGEPDVSESVTLPGIVFDTSVEIDSVTKTIGDSSSSNKEDYQRPLKWNDSWGSRPANADDYYYLIWSIHTTFTDCTQPFNFELIDTPVSQDCEVVGYRLSGQKNFTNVNTATA